MKKIKLFWSKVEYWQKGGIIGLITGIMYVVYLFGTILFTHREVFAPLNDVILYLPRKIGDILFECWFCNSLILFIAILSVIQSILIGAFIGLIIKKVKKK